MAEGPIVFDFTQKTAYRAKQAEDLLAALRPRLSKRRIVKTVEGIPPQAAPQPKS